MNTKLPPLSPEEILKALEAVDEISEQIRNRERDCFKSVFARFCIVKFKALDESKVDILNNDMLPNLTNYYYQFGTPDQFWLMSAETVVENGEYKLNIKFNPQLVTNDEL